MASCEKCWKDSGGDPDKYRELLKSRYCTPEEQAGIYASVCPTCNRKTIHQYARICTNLSCGETKSDTPDAKVEAPK